MSFFNLPPEQCGDDSPIVILPVPFEATTSYGQGTAKGPQAIYEASHFVEIYDEELDDESCDIGIGSRSPVSVTGGAAQVLARVEEEVASIVSSGKFPIVLGGEHSITPAAVRGAASQDPGLTVLQLDAHADLRQEYEGTEFSHACAMARVREHFPAVQVGIRSLSKDEAEWIKRDKLPVFFAKDIVLDRDWKQHVLDAIRTERVYITIDVDAFDTSVMPDTGTPEPGGLRWYETLELLRMVMNRKRVVGLDIVELSPRKGFHASDFTCAKLLYKCIGYWKEGRAN